MENVLSEAAELAAGWKRWKEESILLIVERLSTVSRCESVETKLRRECN